jgi:hypothetical protein
VKKREEGEALEGLKAEGIKDKGKLKNTTRGRDRGRGGRG